MPERLHIRLMALALPLLTVVGCGVGGDDGHGPDPGPGEDPPHVAARTLLTPSAGKLYDTQPDWTEDDRLLVYSAPPGYNLWRLALTGGTPVALTDTTITSLPGGAYKPGCLADGRIAFYQAGRTGDRTITMHVMSVDTAAVAGTPAAVVLRSFSGTAVGLAENQASEPQTLTYSHYGRRAVGLWRTPWLMEWRYQDRNETVVSRSPGFLRGATDVRISRNGLLVTFVDAEGRVSWMDFEGDAATPLDEGSAPSWRGDGGAIGYVDLDGDYVVHDLETGLKTVFEASSLQLSRPVLSWAGDRIAYLIRTADKLGLAVGTLVP